MAGKTELVLDLYFTPRRGAIGLSDQVPVTVGVLVLCVTKMTSIIRLMNCLPRTLPITSSEPPNHLGETDGNNRHMIHIL